VKTNLKTMRTMKLLMLSFAFAMTAALSGCGRAHLSSNYAKAYAAWFTAQHVKTKETPETRRIIERLDAQEAAAVSKNYRRTVSKGEEGGAGSRMLMIGPSRAGGEGYTPPPSVP
jgi:hypothetical protein